MGGELSVATLQTMIKVQQAMNDADATTCRAEDLGAPIGGDLAEAVLARADAAMYAEKRTRSGSRR
ncbi:hypothetical protein [Mycobacterium sp. SA01]|uniref:hypothetical protein n=1 Tax=Mycobacterium sp. SA01 TaxID=3238820 RepID=UPI00351B33FB